MEHVHMPNVVSCGGGGKNPPFISKVNRFGPKEGAGLWGMGKKEPGAMAGFLLFDSWDN